MLETEREIVNIVVPNGYWGVLLCEMGQSVGCLYSWLYDSVRADASELRLEV